MKKAILTIKQEVAFLDSDLPDGEEDSCAVNGILYHNPTLSVEGVTIILEDEDSAQLIEKVKAHAEGGSLARLAMVASKKYDNLCGIATEEELPFRPHVDGQP